MTFRRTAAHLFGPFQRGPIHVPRLLHMVKWPLTEEVISLTLEAHKVAEVVVSKHLPAHRVQPRVDHLGDILAVLVFLQLNNTCEHKRGWWLALGEAQISPTAAASWQR